MTTASRMAFLSLIIGAIGAAGSRPLHAQDAGEADASGREVYEATCVGCHRESGEGIPGLFPPLRENEVVLGASGPLLRVILRGRKAMPAFDETLTDREIAAVTSYVRTSWGNEASLVSPEMVKREGRRKGSP